MLNNKILAILLPILAVLILVWRPHLVALDEAAACGYWVAPAPEGDDRNEGTADSPWATLDYAAEVMQDDDCIVWVKPGRYSGTFGLNRRFDTSATFQATQPYQAILENNGLVVNILGAKNITLEGFIFQHSGPGAEPVLVQSRHNAGHWTENLTLRNNIFRDSYNNDLLKIANAARFVIVEGNVFYNQGAHEEHIDVDSATDVVIQGNIFFNDFQGSGRENANNTKSYITINDSNENPVGPEGSERITVLGNIFLNWEGRKETFIQVGLDGKPYYEAKDVLVANNLLIGNSDNQVYAPFGVRGAKDVVFANNTITGDMPSSAFGMWVSITELNLLNDNIAFYNNIWADPTGTMGSDLSGDANKFSVGNPAQTSNLIIDNNLYWNGGMPIPPGDLLSPLVDDPRPITADPFLNPEQAAIILPRWNGLAFRSGLASFAEEFERLVELYGRIPPGSPAIGRADQAFVPAVDILGRPRSATPILGAYETTIEYAYLPFASSNIP